MSRGRRSRHSIAAVLWHCRARSLVISVGRIQKRLPPVDPSRSLRTPSPAPIPVGHAVSMFGFDCKDPLAGVAPGVATRRALQQLSRLLHVSECNHRFGPRLSRTIAASTRPPACGRRDDPSRALGRPLCAAVAYSRGGYPDALCRHGTQYGGKAADHSASPAGFAVIAGSDPSLAVAPVEVGGKTLARDWFLRNSTWHDDVWIFTPTNLLEHDRPVSIRWSFALPSGRRFTDPSFARLLESSRTLIALIRTRCLSTGLVQRATTVFGYFHIPARVGALDGARRILAICGPRRERTATISALNRATDQSTGCAPGAHNSAKVPRSARVHASVSGRYR